MSDQRIARRGIMFILSSPSGAGKTTISRKMLEQDENLMMSISCTTRPKRPGEIEGKDYYFISETEFSRMSMAHEFLEHAEVFGNYYGTPSKPVMDALEQGKDVLFDIDWQGTRQLKKNVRKDLVSIFILPPSMAELERRLRSRAQDTEEVVQQRMAKASDEISHWDEYDYVIINSALDKTTEKVAAIFQAERLWRMRRHGLEDFTQKLVNETVSPPHNQG